MRPRLFERAGSFARARKARCRGAIFVDDCAPPDTTESLNSFVNIRGGRGVGSRRMPPFGGGAFPFHPSKRGALDVPHFQGRLRSGHVGDGSMGSLPGKFGEYSYVLHGRRGVVDALVSRVKCSFLPSLTCLHERLHHHEGGWIDSHACGVMQVGPSTKRVRLPKDRLVRRCIFLAPSTLK